MDSLARSYSFNFSLFLAPSFQHVFFFFSSIRRHTRCGRDWSSDVCSSDLTFSLAMTLRSPDSQDRRHVMIAMLNFATLVIATMLAAAGAVALQWLLLRAAFLMMRPATARRISVRTELASGTAELARAFASHR